MKLNPAPGLTTVIAVVTVLAALGDNTAHAFPAYAKKEGKPCSYCHVNASGGGKRNAAGLWYKAHNLSLVGFVPGTATAATVKKIVPVKAKGASAKKKAVPKKPVAGKSAPAAKKA